MDCRFSGKWRNRRMREFFFFLWIFAVSDTEFKWIQTPLYGRPHHIYPLLRSLGPAMQLSGSLKGGRTKVTPILTSKQTHTPLPQPKTTLLYAHHVSQNPIRDMHESLGIWNLNTVSCTLRPSERPSWIHFNSIITVHYCTMPPSTSHNQPEIRPEYMSLYSSSHRVMASDGLRQTPL